MTKYESMDTYQEDAKSSDISPRPIRRLYLSLGLAGEAGEVANKIKKLARDKGNISTLQDLSFEDTQAVALELGDVLWYIAMLADEMGYSLSEIADLNIRKLEGRMTNNTLKGDGDNRS